ncbi:hypothetical protein M758_2G181300 [Ceratodon purpureus]|nr:hypothetical protein M758_2G181300 [Ceratodon purpureus]
MRLDQTFDSESRRAGPCTELGTHRRTSEQQSERRREASKRRISESRRVESASTGPVIPRAGAGVGAWAAAGGPAFRRAGVDRPGATGAVPSREGACARYLGLGFNARCCATAGRWLDCGGICIHFVQGLCVYVFLMYVLNTS